MFNDVTISDSHADDDKRARVIAAANDFAAKHPELTKADIQAIHADANNRLFYELNDALCLAATKGFVDQTYITDEIYDLR